MDNAINKAGQSIKEWLSKTSAVTAEAEADFLAQYFYYYGENYDLERNYYDEVTVTDVKKELELRRNLIVSLATTDLALAFPKSKIVSAMSGALGVSSALNLIGKDYTQTYKVRRTQYFDWWEQVKDEKGNHLASVSQVETYIIEDGEMHFYFNVQYTYYLF